MSNVPFYQRRASAVALVLLSGLAILCLSIALQALAWLLPNLFHSVGAALPEPTLLFLDVFGVRSEGYLLQVIWWLWWPMIGALGFCHFRYSDPAEFGRAFLFAFAACWLLVVLAISGILMIVGLAFFILGGTVRDPPAGAELIDVISWLLPLLVLLFLGFTWLSGRRKTERT